MRVNRLVEDIADTELALPYVVDVDTFYKSIFQQDCFAVYNLRCHTINRNTLCAYACHCQWVCTSSCVSYTPFVVKQVTCVKKVETETKDVFLAF